MDFHFWPRKSNRDWIYLLPETTKKLDKLKETTQFSRHWLSGNKGHDSWEITGHKGGEPYCWPRLLLVESVQAEVQGGGAPAEAGEVSLSCESREVRAASWQDRIPERRELPRESTPASCRDLSSPLQHVCVSNCWRLGKEPPERIEGNNPESSHRAGKSAVLVRQTEKHHHLQDTG